MYTLLQFSVAAIGLAGFVSSQSIDPSTVPQGTRDQWCTDQTTSCPLLCLQISNSASTSSNTCDPGTLAYSCVCTSGQQPNASEYSQTIPYFTCTQSNENCVAGCANGDSACQSACRADHPCGATDPTRHNKTSSSTSSSAAASATTGSAAASGSGAVYTGFGGNGGAASTGSTGTGHSSGATLINVGQTYGLVITASLIFGAFAVFL
ncbi:MAG: hypothetical protein Q9227_002383 [Pyrenula ochraceoflavens]